jgi:hypothetical protein
MLSTPCSSTGDGDDTKAELLSVCLIKLQATKAYE